MSKKLIGIVTTPKGQYVKTAIMHTRNGWKLQKTDTWDYHNSLKKHLLLNEGICLGIESHWIRNGITDNQLFSNTTNTEFFSAYTQHTQLEYHHENLENNLVGIFPDDMYLCTLPLFLSEKKEPSFISLFEEEHCWKTGIIIDRKLFAVYSLPRLEGVQVSSFIARLERYWSSLKLPYQFPHTAFIFNTQNVVPGDHFDTYRLKLPSNNVSDIKAFGIAFCNIDSSQPSYCGVSPSARYRNIRSLVYILSILLIIVSGGLFASLFLLNESLSRQITKYENTYKQILTNNKEIKDLFAEGESRAAKLVRIEKFSSNPTRWSQFLHLLGTSRPPKLYFEHLGSEPVKGPGNKVRILLSGWAENETIITELIKKLNTSEMLTNTTLSSMERDEKQKDFCKFKILCILTLSKS